jgi:hypothetical protein
MMPKYSPNADMAALDPLSTGPSKIPEKNKAP